MVAVNFASIPLVLMSAAVTLVTDLPLIGITALVYLFHVPYSFIVGRSIYIIKNNSV